jgi:hypothetical protein
MNFENDPLEVLGPIHWGWMGLVAHRISLRYESLAQPSTFSVLRDFMMHWKKFEKD